MTRLDLSNQSFGHLTAISPAEKIKGRTAWLCRCTCGNECVVTTKDLRSGKRTTCGCRSPGLESLHYVDGTCIEMLRSKTVRSNNKSGVPGVFYDKSKDKWRAEIMFQGKRKTLGNFVDFQDAVKARKKKDKRNPKVEWPSRKYKEYLRLLGALFLPFGYVREKYWNER